MKSIKQFQCQPRLNHHCGSQPAAFQLAVRGSGKGARPRGFKEEEVREIPDKRSNHRAPKEMSIMGEEGLSSSHESGYWTLMAAGKLIAHTAPPGDKALSLPLRCVGTAEGLLSSTGQERPWCHHCFMECGMVSRG